MNADQIPEICIHDVRRTIIVGDRPDIVDASVAVGDVDFEVTMIPHPDGSMRMVSWGELSNWCGPEGWHLFEDTYKSSREEIADFDRDSRGLSEGARVFKETLEDALGKCNHSKEPHLILDLEALITEVCMDRGFGCFDRKSDGERYPPYPPFCNGLGMVSPSALGSLLEVTKQRSIDSIVKSGMLLSFSCLGDRSSWSAIGVVLSRGALRADTGYRGGPNPKQAILEAMNLIEDMLEDGWKIEDRTYGVTPRAPDMVFYGEGEAEA